jgi:hypothetical protein
LYSPCILPTTISKLKSDQAVETDVKSIAGGVVEMIGDRIIVDF